MPKLSLPFFYSILVTGLLLINGCTVLGPDYQEPEVTWLDDWQSTTYPTAENKEEEQATALQLWWHLFNDPALNQLIEAANTDNINLHIAGLRILESRAILGIAGSGLYPQVQQASSAVNYVNSQQHGGQSQNRSQSVTSYSAGFNLSWELDFWGRFKRGIESADAAFLASIANQQDLQVLINAQVTDLYFAYRTTEARITIAHENATLQKRSYEINQRRFKQGQDSELDLQQAKTQYLATLSSIPALEATLIKSRNALAVLLGRAPGELPEITNAEYKLPTIDSTNIQDIPTKLLTRRPDIRAAAWQVAAQSAQIGIAEAEFYPIISLLGSISLSGSNQRGAPDISAFGIGPSLRWNIFDHGRIENNVRVQDARLQQLIENYQVSVLLAASEVDDAAISVLKTAETDQILDDTVGSAKRSLELANIRYREGYADFQRVLDAQRALFTQEDRQLVNHGSHLSAVISLYKGLGGGWVVSPVDKLIPEVIRNSMQQRTDWGDLLTAPIYTDKINATQAHEASPHE
jgi:NodT family efflux transporter outer membrane factor (OMF) lipoprotein